MAALRAGLIGVGVMGAHHARVLSSLEGVELVGIVDPALEGTHLSGVPVSGRLNSLLESGVDYCVVAAPTALHGEIGLQLARAGVHALVEKPLASTSDEAYELMRAFEDAGLVGAVGHIERFNPALQEARRRVMEGQLGSIFQVLTRRQGPFPARVADVGVVKDLATHDVDIASWVTDQSYVEVCAHVVHRAGREHEDMVTITGKLADGTLASHVVNWLTPFKERTVVITGERGALIADTLTADLTFYENGVFATEWNEVASFRGVREGSVIRYAIAKPEPLRVEHEGFRDAVLGRSMKLVRMREGLQAIQVAEAVLQSAEEGTLVRLGVDAT